MIRRLVSALVLPLAALSACTCGVEMAPSTPTAWRASGTEPFWSATMEDGRLRLERPGEPRLAWQVGPPTRTDSGWRLSGDGVTLEAVRGRCANAMSGALFAERVTLRLGGRVLEGCGGAELPPERLEGTQWIVTALDGDAVALAAPPTLAIGEDGTVSGSDGCNRFRGGVTLAASGRVKATGAGASTRMACPGERDAVSRRYAALLHAATQWRFDGARLLLVTADGRTIRLRRSY